MLGIAAQASGQRSWKYKNCIKKFTKREECEMNVIVGFRTKWWQLLILLAVSLGGVSLSGQETRKAIAQASPSYPEVARQFRLSGTVKVEVVIAPDGLVKETKVLGGHPLFVQSALAALKKWKFAPANAETTQTVEFNFKP
jgi:TonB family protein